MIIMRRRTKTYFKEDTTTGRFKREEVTIAFSKSGVDQEWVVRTNNGRLLTDQVSTNWNKPTYLRSVQHCNSLEDVLAYLNFYAYSRFSIKIVRVRDYTDVNTKAILDFDINVKKLQGTVYFGRYEIIFTHNDYDCFVTYIGHLSTTVNDGTFLVRGKRDLLQRTNSIIGKLSSSIEFLEALKKIEIV